jgi:hypothetical protein
MYAPVVQEALQGQIDVAKEVIKTKGITAARAHLAGDLMNLALTKAIRSMYITAARGALQYPLYTIPKKKGAKSLFGDLIKAILIYLDRHLLAKVVLPITQTTIEQVDDVLDDAVTNGWGVDRTVSELDSKELPEWRAKLIVRTEAVRAMNFSQTVAADSGDYEMEKQWIAIEDKRTRLSHSHAGVDGQRVDLYEPYGNGLMFPGDPNGGAAEVCNCRCTQGFFAKRDLEGNLVPKDPNKQGILYYLGNQGERSQGVA